MLVMGIASLVICAVGLYVGYRTGMLKMRYWVRLIWVSSLVVGTFATGFTGYYAANAVAYQAVVGGFHQFLNGTVTAADVEETKCEKDGSCVYEYDCDPYQVPHYSTDEDGEITVTYTTEYHDCPYATFEYRYWTTDSIGNTHDFGSYIAAEPVVWEEGDLLDLFDIDVPELFPTTIPDHIPRGVPGDWQAARTALDNGRGLPMTVEGEYENFILASDEELLKASSDDVDTLLEAGLLPEHTQNLHSPIYGTFNANKVNFVGFTPDNEAEWQESVMQFNAALGSELRGDLHVVVIKDSALPSDVSADDYANALKAYWLNHLDKYAFGKNGIMVVIGIDDRQDTVKWARASTGMPTGNGVMLSWIETSLLNESYDLPTLMGETYATVVNGEASYTIGEGLIPQAIMVDVPFERVCMRCDEDGEGEGIGFSDLTINSEVEWWGYLVTILLQVVILALPWGLFFYNNLLATDRYEEIEEESTRMRERGSWRDELRDLGPLEFARRIRQSRKSNHNRWS